MTGSWEKKNPSPTRGVNDVAARRPLAGLGSGCLYMLSTSLEVCSRIGKVKLAESACESPSKLSWRASTKKAIVSFRCRKEYGENG